MSDETNIAYSKMTGARQIMLSWAREICTLDELPQLYRPAFARLFEGAAAMPYSVLAPAQSAGRGSKPAERLLVDGGDRFYLLERAGSEVLTTGYRYQDIVFLETGKILLYSWFSIYGKTVEGREKRSIIEFNEVTWRYFQPFFGRIRPAPVGDAGRSEADPFDALARVNYKLMNFAYDGLVSGEYVLQYVYQPEIRQPWLSVLGRKFYRTTAFTHLAILTDQELIFIGDVEQVTDRRRSSYGGAWQYLPMRSLQAVTLAQQPDGLLCLTAQLSADFQVTRLFEPAQRAEVEHLKQTLEQRIGLAEK